MAHLSTEQAQGFYAVHKDRPFFNDLVSFMTSGPVMIQVLEGDNAVLKNRELMGATNPKEGSTRNHPWLILQRALTRMQCMALIL